VERERETAREREGEEGKKRDVEGNLFASGVFILENVTVSLSLSLSLSLSRSRFLLTEINWIPFPLARRRRDLIQPMN